MWKQTETIRNEPQQWQPPRARKMRSLRSSPLERGARRPGFVLSQTPSRRPPGSGSGGRIGGCGSELARDSWTLELKRVEGNGRARERRVASKLAPTISMRPLLFCRVQAVERCGSSDRHTPPCGHPSQEGSFRSPSSPLERGARRPGCVRPETPSRRPPGSGSGGRIGGCGSELARDSWTLELNLKCAVEV